MSCSVPIGRQETGGCDKEFSRYLAEKDVAPVRYPDREMRRRLERHRDRWCSEHPDVELHYRGGPHDFLLREGRSMPARQLPPDAPRDGDRRLCALNALAIAAVNDLRYVEGFAMVHASYGATEHAWCLDRDGYVVDVTWDDRCFRNRTARAAAVNSRAYIGVVFSPWRGFDAVFNGGASILDDKRRGWPVLQRPWGGEDLRDEPERVLHELASRSYLSVDELVEKYTWEQAA